MAEEKESGTDKQKEPEEHHKESLQDTDNVLRDFFRTKLGKLIAYAFLASLSMSIIYAAYIISTSF